VREGDGDQGFERGKRAQLDSFEITRDLLDDLLGAKNAGVTPTSLVSWVWSGSNQWHLNKTGFRGLQLGNMS
jgi:hypothetical protein